MNKHALEDTTANLHF